MSFSSATMQAAWYERIGPAREVLQVGQLPIPEPRHGEILVRVGASGVNPHDVKKRSGWLGRDLPCHRVIPHSDCAGVVAALGSGVETFRAGDRVFIYGAGHARLGEGTAAEFVAVPADNALPLPSAITFAEGASLGVPAFTAFYALLADGPVTGQTVLVQGGAGAVGNVAVELACWNGANVIATTSSTEKADVARAAGAHWIIDYVNEDVAARVREITAGAGVDRIIEVDFGANLALDAAIIKENGTIASYSSTRVREPVLPYYAFAMKGVRLHMLQATNMPRVVRDAGARTILALLARRMLRPRIARRLRLGEIITAHELMERGGAIGNIVVEFPESQLAA